MINTAAFEAWLHDTGRRWYHLTNDERRAALAEFKAGPRQFTYTLTKGERVDQVRCTAKTAELARAVIASEYGPAYTVSPEPIAIGEPHRILGEIDATACTAADVAYTQRGQA